MYLEWCLHGFIVAALEAAIADVFTVSHHILRIYTECRVTEVEYLNTMCDSLLKAVSTEKRLERVTEKSRRVKLISLKFTIYTSRQEKLLT